MPVSYRWFAGGGTAVAAVLMALWFFNKRNLLNIGRKALQDKVILITGASSGLGEACAHIFYASGCRLILCARRKEQLERVKHELEENSFPVAVHEPKVLPLDLANLSSIPVAMETAISYYGHVDVVINNGGISYRGAIEETLLDVDLAVMNVNYFGQVAVTKGLLRQMIERRSGHIVAVSSIQGKLALPFRSAYGASKHALQCFFDGLRAEVQHYGISVSVVIPNYIRTSLSMNALTKDGTKYGVMDETQDKGMNAMDVAQSILNAVICRENEIILAPFLAKIAVYFKNFLPNVFGRIMEARANKHLREKLKQS